MLGIRNTVAEMKDGFDGLIGRLDMAEGRVSELEAMSTETTKTEKQRKKKIEKKKKENYLRTMRQL